MVEPVRSGVGEIASAYRGYGDALPPSRTLDQFVEGLSQHRTPTALVIAGDILIDRAQRASIIDETPGPAHYLGLALEQLQAVDEQLARLQAERAAKSLQAQAHNGIIARLRTAELKLWRSALTERRIPTAYDDLLEGAQHAMDLIKTKPQAVDQLIEFVPIILGARQREERLGGWIARLSLQREGRRPAVTREHNANWDFGVSENTASQYYIRPEHRVDIYKTQKKHINSYVRAGVMPINARPLGISDPLAVINGCLVEADLLESAPGALGTDELDERADRLHERIFRTDIAAAG